MLRRVRQEGPRRLTVDLEGVALRCSSSTMFLVRDPNIPGALVGRVVHGSPCLSLRSHIAFVSRNALGFLRYWILFFQRSPRLARVKHACIEFVGPSFGYWGDGPIWGLSFFDVRTLCVLGVCCSRVFDIIHTNFKMRLVSAIWTIHLSEGGPGCKENKVHHADTDQNAYKWKSKPSLSAEKRKHFKR